MNGHKIARGAEWVQNEAVVNGGKECGQPGEVPVNVVTGGNLCRGSEFRRSRKGCC